MVKILESEASKILELSAPIMAIGARSLFGWMNNSFKDGEIQLIEWQKLGATFARLGALTVFVYLGLGELGADVSATGSASLASLVDVLRNDVLEPLFKKK